MTTNNTLPVPPYLGEGGHYGRFGGRFSPEALVAALDEVAVAWEKAKNDPDFQAELQRLLTEYTGRPSPLTEVPQLPRALRRGPDPAQT